MPAVPASPCLYSNISTENAQKCNSQDAINSQKVEAIRELSSLLSPYHKKAAQTLFLNVERLVSEVPSIGHIAFLTLTFSDNVTDHKEAYRRYRSWNSHFFAKHPSFGHYINTKEVQTRGAWHFHILIQLTGDIREGFDFEAYRQWLDGNNRFKSPCPTGNAFLRSLWSDLRENLEPYGLGRIHSLEPIESTAEAIGRYVGKYISKHIENRTEQQKGVRLVNYSRGWVRNSSNFAWNTENSHEWRRKLSIFARYHGCTELYQLSEKLGPCWVYKNLEDILSIDLINLERIVNDRAAGIETKPPEFQSNTVKKAIDGQKRRQREKINPKFNESVQREIQKKKQENKKVMGQLTSQYTEEWIAEETKQSALLDLIDIDLMQTIQMLEVGRMKKSQKVEYKYLVDLPCGSTLYKKTGEVVPF